MTGPLFVRLEVTWLDNPKVIAAGMAGKGLHAAAMCLSKRLETDGWIDRALLHREGADDALIDQCVELGLLDVDGRRVRPAGWLDRNPSQDAIDATRATKAGAARRGNHKRWHGNGPIESCEKCQVDRISDRIGSHPDRKLSPDTETETTTPTQVSGLLTTPEPDPPTRGDAQSSKVQVHRRAAALVGRAVADRSGATNPAAYAATVTATILTGPDPEDRDRITAALEAGETPETIAAGWVPDPLAAVLRIDSRARENHPTARPLPAFDPSANEAEAERQRLAYEAQGGQS